MMVLVGFIYNGVFWLLIRSLKCEAIWHVGSGLQEVEAAMDPYQLLSFEKKKLKKKKAEQDCPKYTSLYNQSLKLRSSSSITTSILEWMVNFNCFRIGYQILFC